MKKLSNSQLSFGGFILLSFLLVNYLFRFIQYQLSDLPYDSTFIPKSIVYFFILGIPFVLFLINIIIYNARVYSVLGFGILLIYELTQIIPDIYYFNMTKVSSSGYYILIYSLISIILILRDKNDEIFNTMNKKSSSDNKA